MSKSGPINFNNNESITLKYGRQIKWLFVAACPSISNASVYHQGCIRKSKEPMPCPLCGRSMQGLRALGTRCKPGPWRAKRSLGAWTATQGPRELPTLPEGTALHAVMAYRCLPLGV